MKRLVKILALCLCVAALGMLFTGCDYIDDLRANQAFLSADKESISFRGETYIKISSGDSIYVGSSYSYDYTAVAVTDEDVPVLLSDVYNYPSDYDPIRDVFSVVVTDSITDAYSYNGSYVYTYFCNEKDYDMYVKALNSSTMDFIGIEYCVSYKDGWRYDLVALSKEASYEIISHIQNSNKMSEDLYNKTYYEYPSLDGCIYRCDGDAIAAQYLDGFDIVKNPSTNAVYLVDYTFERAVELSAETSAEFTDDFFYGKYVEDINEYTDDTDIFVV